MTTSDPAAARSGWSQAPGPLALVALAVLGVATGYLVLGWAAASRMPTSEFLDDGGPRLLAHTAAMTALTVLGCLGARVLVAAGCELHAWVLVTALLAGPMSVLLAPSLLHPADEDPQPVPGAVTPLLAAVIGLLAVVGVRLWQRRHPMLVAPASMTVRLGLLGLAVAAGVAALGSWQDAGSGDNQLWVDAGHGPIPVATAVGWAVGAVLLGAAACLGRGSAPVVLALLAWAVPPLMYAAYQRSGGYPAAPGWGQGPLFSTLGFAGVFVLVPTVGAVVGVVSRRLRGSRSAQRGGRQQPVLAA